MGMTGPEISAGGGMVVPKAARWGFQSRSKCGGFILLEEDGRSKWMGTVLRAGAGPGGLGTMTGGLMRGPRCAPAPTPLAPPPHCKDALLA